MPVADREFVLLCDVFGCTWSTIAQIDSGAPELSAGEADWIRGRQRRELEGHMQAHGPTYRCVDGPLQGRAVDSSTAEEFRFIDDGGRQIRYYRTTVAGSSGVEMGHVYSVHAVLATCRRTPREMLGLYPEWKDRLDG